MQVEKQDSFREYIYTFILCIKIIDMPSSIFTKSNPYNYDNLCKGAFP